MKQSLFLLLLLSYSFSGFGQNQDEFIHQKWHSNFVLGSDTYSAVAQQEKITLELMDENVYGTFLELKSDGTFTSYNQGPCGNECRVRTTGNYIFNNSDSTISFTLTDINYMKMCFEMNEKKKALPLYVGTFKLYPADNGYSLKRISK